VKETRSSAAQRGRMTASVSETLNCVA